VAFDTDTDPVIHTLDSDPDPAVFSSGFQDANKYDVLKKILAYFSP
jgi:hypothetical protein